MSSEREGTRRGRVPVLISACLIGLPTRFDGGGRLRAELLESLAGEWLVPVCPEQLGGLPTPRAAQDIFPGGPGAGSPAPADAPGSAGGEEVLDGSARVVNRDGVDVTEAFVRGARSVAELAERLGARRAYLAARSPSCAAASYGVGARLSGVAAAALARSGVEVIDVE